MIWHQNRRLSGGYLLALLIINKSRITQNVRSRRHVQVDIITILYKIVRAIKYQMRLLCMAAVDFEMIEARMAPRCFIKAHAIRTGRWVFRVLFISCRVVYGTSFSPFFHHSGRRLPLTPKAVPSSHHDFTSTVRSLRFTDPSLRQNFGKYLIAYSMN